MLRVKRPLMNVDDRRIQRQVWLVPVVALALYGGLRLWVGPLPQDPTYHVFADTRTCFDFLPHAGDVLTNLAMLAAGLFGLALRKSFALAPDERRAADVLIAGAILTACGSAYYHWAPSNTTIVWDRLPMTLVFTSVLVLVIADRVHPLFARYALWPFTLFGAASVLLWGLSEAMGQGDLGLYLIVRIGSVSAIALLLILREARHSGTKWLVAALVCEIALAVFERLDHELFLWSGDLVSGHNLKHVTAGLALAFVFWWLRVRRPMRPKISAPS